MLGNEIYPVDDTMMHQTVDLVDDRGEQSTYNVIDHLYFVPKVKENHYLHLRERNIISMFFNVSRPMKCIN